MQKIFFVFVLAVAVGYGWWAYQEQFGGPELDARDTAALRTVNQIVEAQKNFRAKYKTYAKQIYQLGPPLTPGGPSEHGAGLIPRDIATGKKLSYQFRIRGYGDSYSLNADPIGPPASADSAPMRHFFADETGAVRFAVGAPANDGSELVR